MAGASASAFGIATAYAALRPDPMVLKSKAVHWVAALFGVNALLTARTLRFSGWACPCRWPGPGPALWVCAAQEELGQRVESLMLSWRRRHG